MPNANQIERVCHYNKLFIAAGQIYPCCFNTKNVICKVKDSNLYEKIKNFYEPCECAFFKNRKPTTTDDINLKIIRTSLSRNCQAKCVMCLSSSSGVNEPFDLYNEIEELIAYYKPEKLEVAGGEVTIQKESMEWLEKIKAKYNPSIKVITNCNLPLSMIEKIEKIFDVFAISFVGFQPETYKTIMGLDINKTMAFLNALIENNKMIIQLKYLETPINIHETHLFLDWAIKTSPNKIYLHHTFDILDYINFKTWDDYWNKIIEITGKKVRQILIDNKETLSKKENYISIWATNAKYYKIDTDFLKENNLIKTVNIS